MKGRAACPYWERPGWARRLDRILRRDGHRALGVPFDDLLISGPLGHLRRFDEIILQAASSGIDFTIGFPWFFQRFGAMLTDLAWIVNLTASTVRSHHTRKVVIGSVEDACAVGADGVAVHVNFTDEAEAEMLAALSAVSRECRKFGMPLLALAYVRRQGPNGDDNYYSLRENDPEAYADLIAHACHAVVELGADLVKTQYTGSVASFERVLKAVHPVPVIIAGGPAQDEPTALKLASDALLAGANGLCFGRNTYCRSNIGEFLGRLGALVPKNQSDR
jgi:fructose-bisphosphate aldolase/2-amino-3,7-dideoxy-D-threo-hept-6-ulosonate synthase